jgi:fructose-specific phosphotransferase system IIC component
MADQFVLSGSYTVTPLSLTSLDPSLATTIEEPLALKSKQLSDMTLSVDTPIAVPFGTVVNAHVVILKALGGKVKARITSADGATQAIPFDTVLILMSQTVPITAIDLTRVAATATTVKVLLGEKA